MSEPIQAISQGNYILQGTVATSAGIIGDGSTQNPLRADETVLWSGLNYINSAGFASITLSEATTNFNTVKIAFARGGNFAGDEVFEFVPDDSKTYLASLDCYDNNFTSMYCYFNSFTLSGSTFAELNGKCGYYQVINGTSPGASVNKTWCWLHPYKIVGINRINNA